MRKSKLVFYFIKSDKIKAHGTVIMHLRSLTWTTNGNDDLHAPAALIPEKGPSGAHFHEVGVELLLWP
jgi:hypothetical protein